MGFSFRLEKVLDLRKSREEAELRKLKDLELELHSYQRARTETMKKSIRLEAELRHLEQRGQTPHFWGIYHRYLAHLQVHLAEIDTRIRDCRERIAKQRESVLQAAKERKVLENLRDKQLAMYQAEQLRREQSALDDLAGQRFKRTKEDE